jgi:single-strand DNA-binding protein
MPDFNQIQIIGFIGGDPEIRSTQNGKEVATFSVATDTGWKDKDTGEWKKNTNWHRIVTFQPALIKLIKERAKKGMRVFVQGELNYREYTKDGEQTPRQVGEIVLGFSSVLNLFSSAKADE